MALDKLSFKIIDGEIAVGELPVYEGIVGIFINDRELLDIVADLENEHLEGGYTGYIHQRAYQLYGNLVPEADVVKEWQEENGTEILCCSCGEIVCASPTVFIEKDEQHVYWKNMGHNYMAREHYFFALNYVFDRKQYEQALEELKRLAEDKNIY